MVIISSVEKYAVPAVGAAGLTSAALAWPDYAEKNGTAMIVLGIFGSAVWTAMKWAAPMIRELAERHFKFMDSLDTRLAQQCVVLNSIGDTLKMSNEASIEAAKAAATAAITAEKAAAAAASAAERLHALTIAGVKP